MLGFGVFGGGLDFVFSSCVIGDFGCFLGFSGGFVLFFRFSWVLLVFGCGFVSLVCVLDLILSI